MQVSQSANPQLTTFCAFPVSAFVSAFAIVGQTRPPPAVSGGHFSTSPPGNQTLVGGGAKLSEPKPDVPKLDMIPNRTADASLFRAALHRALRVYIPLQLLSARVSVQHFWQPHP